MRMGMDKNTNNIIKKTTKGNKVNNKDITDISRVMLDQLVSHLNNVAKTHKVKLKKR